MSAVERRHVACSLDIRRRGTGSRAYAPGMRFRNRWLRDCAHGAIDCKDASGTI